jgi:hypothetical protein
MAAESQERETSRYTYRSIDSGTAEQLAQPREPVGKIRVIKTEPLVGNARRTTSTDSTATSNLTGSSGIAAKAAQNAAYSVTAPVRFVPAIRAAATNVQAAQETEGSAIRTASNVADRTLVDRNARFVKAYHEAYPNAEHYQPATVVEPDPEQFAMASGYSPRVVYGNTYSTYSPATYHSRVAYSSYVGYSSPRVYVASSYSSPSYYSSGYCAPTRYSSYCAPTYYRPQYVSYCQPTYYQRASYCRTPSYYYPRSSFSIGYSWGGRSHCGFRGGSSFGIGFSFGW